MSRIKLRNLLNLTEQAPQPPPMGGDMAPAPAPAQPGMNAGQPEQPATPPTPDTSPEPEDPGEYDFTKDFRAFEDKKNKAEADAKKVLVDKMNERLLGKTIVANASRGYGQPKTDYTIKNVKKISVEFWYKDYVVIASDENDKKYFLTPGINIKIEQGAEQGAPEGSQPPTAGGQEEPEAETPSGGQESPNNGQPPIPSAETEPEAQGQGQPQQATQADAEPEQPVAPNQEAPQQTAAPTNGKPNSVPQEDPRLKKKKKMGVAENEENGGVRMESIPPEMVQQNLGNFFAEFLGLRKIDLTPYVRKAESSGRNTDGGYYTEYVLEIPKQLLGNNFDARDFSLEFRNYERNSGGPGQPFSRGNVDVQERGRFYTFRFSLSGGLDI